MGFLALSEILTEEFGVLKFWGGGFWVLWEFCGLRGWWELTLWVLAFEKF